MTRSKLERQDVFPHPKERILQVALELFTKHGYAATSIEDIRLATGFKSKASLYAHFKSKEAISDDLKKQVLQEIEEALFAAYNAAGPDPFKQFVEVMRAYIGWGFAHRQKYAFRIIRAQEERMEKGEYDWQRDLRERENSAYPNNIYTLIMAMIQQLRRDGYPVRDLPDAALFHMLVGAISRAVIDRDSSGKSQPSEDVDWSAQVDLTLEACMGMLLKR